MNILVFGANGFVGSHVVKALSDHNVYKATRNNQPGTKEYFVDLQQKDTIIKALKNLKPDVVINCAGVVYSGEDVNNNQIFTQNLLESIAECEQKPKVIISGSAGEYGPVDKLPVSEDAPIRASAGYGLSKANEVKFALNYGKQHNIQVIVARIFNPLGPSMHPRFLSSGILRQIKEIESGHRAQIEVSRLDAQRDYLHIDDVADAIKLLVEGQPKHSVYNIGSGVSTTTEQLIDLILKHSSVRRRPTIVETSKMPEQYVASRADISRLREEFGWAPKHGLEETVKELVDAER